MIVGSELTQFKAYNAHKTEVLPVWGHAGLNTKKKHGPKDPCAQWINFLCYEASKPRLG